MISKKLFERIFIKTTIDAFHAGYGKNLTNHIKEKLTEYAKLQLHNPAKKIYRFRYCDDAKQYTTQECIGNNSWLCRHDGTVHHEER